MLPPRFPRLRLNSNILKTFCEHCGEVSIVQQPEDMQQANLRLLHALRCPWECVSEWVHAPAPPMALIRNKRVRKWVDGWDSSAYLQYVYYFSVPVSTESSVMVKVYEYLHVARGKIQ